MRADFTLLLVTLVASASALSAESRSLDVKVIRITDGDTIVAIDSNRLEHKIRLAGIDAPEKGQAFGDRSRQNLSDLVAGKNIRIEWSKVDQYGRFVAAVTVPSSEVCKPPSCQEGLVDVNLSQVIAGLAWHYKEFEKEQRPRERAIYAGAEQQARAAKLGLWRDPDPIAPWEFRHGPPQGPVKKSRSDICHDASMSTYSSVQKFERFATLDECIASGGRLPKNVTR